MKINIQKTLLLITMAGVLMLLPITFASMGHEQPPNEEDIRIQKAIQQNMELWRTRSDENPGVSYERTSRELGASYDNFKVYMRWMLDSKSGEAIEDLEILNAGTGELLLRGPSVVYCSDMEGALRCDNHFFEYDSDTLLWVQNYGDINNPSICYLVGLDGELTPIECSARIVKTAWEQCFLIAGKDKTRTRADKEGVRKPIHAYGVVAHDLKTILLPAEYGGPDLDNGGMYYPYFSGGYMFAQRDGKFGVISCDLNEKVPFIYDKIVFPHRAQVCSYGHTGTGQGILFLESGILLEDVTYQESGIHTVIVTTSPPKSDKITDYRLLDRSGKLLYKLPNNGQDTLSYDENCRPLLNGQPLDIPALTAKSDWAAPAIDSARAAGLIPAELDQMYQSVAVRRDLCMLAVQLVRILRPELCETAGQQIKTVYWDCTDSEIPMEDINLAAQLGMIRGEGCFEPFLPITRQDAADMLKNTAQLLGTETNGKIKDILYRSDSGSISFDSDEACTSEQLIAAVYCLYQSIKD